MQSSGASLLGWWQLVSCEIELQASDTREPMYDAPAHGYLVFAPDGRMMTVIGVLQNGAHADPGTWPNASRGVAYTGRYRVEGNRWLTEVDVDSLPGWTGSIQERSFLIETDRLHVCSAWCVSPLHGNQVVRARVVWKRPSECAAESS